MPKYGIKLEDVSDNDWLVWRGSEKRDFVVGYVRPVNEGKRIFGHQYGDRVDLNEISDDGFLKDFRRLKETEIPDFDTDDICKKTGRERNPIPSHRDDCWVIMNHYMCSWGPDKFDTKEDAVQYVLSQSMNPYDFVFLRASVEIEIKYLLDPYIEDVMRNSDISRSDQFKVAKDKFGNMFCPIIYEAKNSKESDTHKDIEGMSTDKARGYLSAKSEDNHVFFNGYDGRKLSVVFVKKNVDINK